MHGDDHVGLGARLHGPWIWLVSAAVGTGLGALLAKLVPGAVNTSGAAHMPLWLVAPFALLLASIALMPFVSERIWHRHFPDFSLGLGGFVLGYCLVGFPQPDPSGHGTIGSHAVKHAFLEYYSFIALVCGVFVVSGGVLIRLKGKATPLLNVGLMAFGAVFANFVGTTGASMLLLRPFMRVNKGRLRPIHIVMFIMIVSNCGGCLTPIGDPPLYLGFIKGVPFFWTLTHLWKEWLLVVGLLLAILFAIDTSFTRKERPGVAGNGANPKASRFGFSIFGYPGLVFLALMILGVFIDPFLNAQFGLEGFPYGATFQLLVAAAAYFTADPRLHHCNRFSFFPAKEVGLLFLGIFLTMIPALGYLSQNGTSLGVDSPTAFYFLTGALSAVLDNAPTYVNFLQIAVGPVDISAATIRELVSAEEGKLTLAAISTGSVFFGAMSYIGNGPNFMVRAIASRAGVRMPSFFGYIWLAILILLPVLALNWLLLIR